MGTMLETGEDNIKMSTEKIIQMKVMRVEWFNAFHEINALFKKWFLSSFDRIKYWSIVDSFWSYKSYYFGKNHTEVIRRFILISSFRRLNLFFLYSEIKFINKKF